MSLADLAAPTPNSLATGPFGSSVGAKYFRTSGVPLIRGSNLSVDVGRRLLDEQVVYLDLEKAAEFQRSQAVRGDLVFTCWGTIGQVGLIDGRARFDRYIVSNKQMKLTPDPARVDPLFLYYALSSPRMVAAVQAIAIGSSVPGFNLSQLRQVAVVLPSPREQHAIAEVLGALDDKIEANRRNVTLVSDFIAATWLGCFGLSSDSGWPTTPVGDLASVVGGSTPSTKVADFWDGTIAWATPRDLARLSSAPLLDTERHITELGLQQISSGLLPVGTVLLSSRAPIGYLAIAEVPLAVNQGFIALVAGGRVSNLYLWQWLRSHLDEVISRANGTTFLEVSKANFRPMPIEVPPEGLMRSWTASAATQYRLIVAKEQESGRLTQLRDTLLPKLLSGELRVRDAEALAEEAV